MRVTFRMTDGQYQTLLDTTRAGPVLALCGQCRRPSDHCFMLHRFCPANGKHSIDSLVAAASAKGMAVLVAGRAHASIADALSLPVKKADLPMLRVEVSEHNTLTGRLADPGGRESHVNRFSVVGDHLNISVPARGAEDLPRFAERHAQCLGEATAHLLRQLTVGIVGLSGTGSIVTEQLARLGIGRMVLVDPETIEARNLNRILNSGAQDIGCHKTDVAAKAVERMELGTEVMAVPANLATSGAVRAISLCDVVFGCVDSAEGRHLLNRVAAFYTIPYFDVGLHLSADGKGGIGTIYGSVHFIRPGGSSMLSRGVISEEQIRYDARRRQFPLEPAEVLEGDYIKGVKVDSPAVISFNMFYASLAVIEFLNRLHQFREGVSPSQDWICVNLSEDSVLQVPMQWNEEPCPCFARYVGRGDMVPLLDRPEMSPQEAAV